MIVVIALVLLLATTRTADARPLFDFSWTSTASFSTLVRANRVEPDGSITPYDQVRIDGTRTGSGLLVLAPLADEEGSAITFGGAGVRHTGPVTATEPSSMLLVGIAMLTLARLRRRRK